MLRIVSPFLKIHFNKYHWTPGVYGLKSRLKAPQYSVSEIELKNRKKYEKVYQLSEAFKKYGFLAADLDPLKQRVGKHPVYLDPAAHDLEVYNTAEVPLNGLLNISESEASVEKITEHLNNIYCDKIGVEFYYLEDGEKEWFSREFEKIQTETNFSQEEKIDLYHELQKSQIFDRFLAVKFTSLKHYGGEGAESMMVFLKEIFNLGCLSDLRDILIGIPHRGRLNLLTGLLQFPPVAMFNKIMGFPEFPNTKASCDVLLHLTSSIQYEYNKNSVHISMLPNPSHLEAVSPVVVGYSRSRLQSLQVGDYGNSENATYPVLPIQVHGDAAFTGQGVVMETLSMSNLPNYSVGGSIHLIVNNQIGFTTPQSFGRSSPFPSDVMKMISAPVIHVNGDYPEEVVKAARLAFKYRQLFQKDVLVDLICFRRWGHNELDDPTFTHPRMYKIINSRKSVPDLYAERLISDNIITKENHEEMVSAYHNKLNEDLKMAESYKIEVQNKYGNTFLKENVSVYDTGVPIDLLKFVGAKSLEYPTGFDVHPTLVKHFIADRKQKILTGNMIDWATAEALAIGSLLYQGCNVRLSGQDVGRGTFCHRHAMFVDQTTGFIHVPLNHMHDKQSAFYEVANSILSEEAVLSFEYGFSVENIENLVIWEAQFGDFFNSAQVVFDTFISSGESKWLLPSRIVILLPHGYDGAGPEHSSCRIERFLQMCDSKENQVDSDDVNWHIANPTTPSQYFHLLRNQIISQVPKPLIVVAPKILLRHPQAVSTLADLQPGTNFQQVLDEPVNATNVKKVIFCTGKHYYLLQKEKETRKLSDVAIVRLEKLCPFPAENLYRILNKYKDAKNFIWSQEEHRNMGAWTFIQTRFENILGCKLKYAGRKPLAAVAVGCGKYHQEEIDQLLKETFE